MRIRGHRHALVDPLNSIFGMVWQQPSVDKYCASQDEHNRLVRQKLPAKVSSWLEALEPSPSIPHSARSQMHLCALYRLIGACIRIAHGAHGVSRRVRPCPPPEIINAPWRGIAELCSDIHRLVIPQKHVQRATSPLSLLLDVIEPIKELYLVVASI